MRGDMKSRKRALRIVLVLSSLVAVLVVSGIVAIHTQAFNRFMIRKIADATEKRTGEELSLGKLVIDWGELKVDIDDLTLRKPSPETPFLTCDHVTLGLKIVSLWKREMILSELVVQHPVVQIVITHQGQDNLPHSTSNSNESAADTLVDLGIRHFVLTSGEIVYNDRQTPIAADLHDVQALVQFETASQRYRGSLAYDRGRIAVAQLAPFDHDARIQFQAGRSSFELTSVQLSTGNSQLSAKGIVSDYSNPRVQASYEATLFTPDLARVLKLSMPSGTVRTVGSLQYAYSRGEPFLASARVAGSAEATTLDVTQGQFFVRVRNVRAQYVLDHSAIDVRNAGGEALGGTLAGALSITNLNANPSGRLSASIRGASLADLTRSMPRDRNQHITPEGSANADVQSTWAGSLSNAMTHLRATITGPLSSPARDAIPVNASLDFQFDGRRNIATFAPSSIKINSAQLSFSGTLSNRSSLAVQANSNDLAQLSQLISSFEPVNSKSTQPVLMTLALQGSASFSGQVQGSVTEPRIQGHLIGANLVVKGETLTSIRGDITLSPSTLSVQHLDLGLQDKGHLDGEVQVTLNHWSVGPDAPLTLQASFSNLSLTDLQRLANVQYPVSGNLNGNLSLHGSENNPAGQASINISNVSAWDQSIQQLAIRLSGDGNLLDAKVQAQTPAGTISSEFKYSPKSRSYEGHADAKDLNLEKISLPAARGFEARGAATISASGKGTIENPQLSAQIQIPELQIRDQMFSRFNAQVNLNKEHAVVSLASNAVGGYAQAKCDIDLTGNYFARGSVDVKALPIGPVLASYVPQVANTVQGDAEFHATLTGPLKQPEKIQAHIQVPTLNLAYQSVRLGLANPMRLDYADGILTIASADITGTGTNLSIHGAIPLRSQRAIDITADGTVDLALLQTFSPAVKSSGQIRLQINGSGDTSSPSIQGRVQVQNAMFSSNTFPVSLEGINGQIRLAGNRLDIEQLSGTAGGGNLSASGFLIYGKQMSFSLSAHAQSLRLRYPEGLRTLLDADLNLTGSPDSSTLAGRVLIDRLSFTKQLDMATLIGEFSSDIPSTAPPPFEEKMKLNVALASTNQLNVTGSKLSIGGSVNMTVGGTVADPVMLGRVVLTQGEVFFLGKRYEIQSGAIAFSNPVRTEPVLNIYAKTTVEQYNITINFIGPVDRLRTNYTSDPPLSEADIIHLVAFGTTAEEAATTSTPTNLAAESVVAQGVSSQVSGKLEQLTGISQITLDPLVTNSAANPASQIAVQERVSGSLLVTFSADVTSTQNQIVEVQYKAQKNVMVSIIRDYNGGYALDVRIRKTF